MEIRPGTRGPTPTRASRLPVSRIREEFITYSFGSLATSKIVGQNFFTTNNTINQRTGLVSASTDSAGVVTSFVYDELGRVRKVDSFADEDTYYTYTPAAGSSLAQVTIERKSSETDPTPLAVGSITFDNLVGIQGAVSRPLGPRRR